MTSVDRTVRPSFTKSMFAGRIASELVLPYPQMAAAEKARVETVSASAREVLAGYDPLKAERDGWIGDDFVRELGERGLMGLFVSEEYGGLGLGQSAYCRVYEEFGRVDGTLATIMGVHQSIGTKPLHLYGTDDQKARWLPDLASGRKLAAFVLTEPNVGSDAYALETRAERQSDGSWLLNGEKRWIGNGDKDILTVFAQSDLGHVALIVEKGMDGLSTGPRFETHGLKANHLQRVHFNDVRVPAENLLGEPGDGFRIAVNTLNNGRMSMGTAIAGGMKTFLELSLDHTEARHQFGRPLADFEMVGDKLAWMTQQIYGIESMSYLTTGLVDRGDTDFALESAMTKVAASDTGWYALNRAVQLHGGEAYMEGHPLSKALRDFRIFPIFEGANDVLRAFVALNGLKTLGDELPDVASFRLGEPGRALGVLAPYVAGRVQRRMRPDKPVGVHPALATQAAEVGQQVARLRERAEGALRRHGKKVQEKQLVQKRLADAASGIYAQTAVLSRASTALQEARADSDAERQLAVGFCRQSADTVGRQLRALEVNDDRRTIEVAKATRASGGYSFSL